MTDPKFSAGARLERKAFRDYLRRQLAKSSAAGNPARAWEKAIEWVLARQQRYDKREGGL